MLKVKFVRKKCKKEPLYRSGCLGNLDCSNGSAIGMFSYLSEKVTISAALPLEAVCPARGFLF